MSDILYQLYGVNVIKSKKAKEDEGCVEIKKDENHSSSERIRVIISS